VQRPKQGVIKGSVTSVAEYRERRHARDKDAQEPRGRTVEQKPEIHHQTITRGARTSRFQKSPKTVSCMPPRMIWRPSQFLPWICCRWSSCTKATQRVCLPAKIRSSYVRRYFVGQVFLSSVSGKVDKCRVGVLRVAPHLLATNTRRQSLPSQPPPAVSPTQEKRPSCI
jgi:hypothetical protein